MLQGESADTRDRYPDAYHSCYGLAGLSSAQHKSTYVSNPGLDGAGPLDPAFSWTPSAPVEQGADPEAVSDDEDLLPMVHPIFVIPYAAVERCRAYFAQKRGF